MTADWNLADVGTVYRAAFCARTDAYAAWSGDHEHRSRRPDGTEEVVRHAHWHTVREELTIDRILAGLTGERPPVSTYMDDREGCTHVLAIDFDRDDGWALGLATAKAIEADGGHAYIERSRRGCHLWVTTQSVSGETARHALRHWLGRASPEAARDPKCEIMPQAVQRGPDTVGHSLRLPMMPHQRSGERHALCDAEGVPLGKTLGEIVLRLEDTDPAVVRAAAARIKATVAEVQPPDWMRRPRSKGGDVVAILQEHGVQRAAPGRTVRCPLHPDSSPSMTISRDSERAWCHNPECDGFNGGRGLGSDQLARALEAIGRG
jgi:hypothetical protein